MTYFVASDVEGTLTTAVAWKGIRTYCHAHGRGGAFQRFFFSQLPAVVAHRLGWLGREAARDRWMLDMARVFAGDTPEALDAAGEWLAEQVLWPERRPEIVDELLAHHAAGATVLLVSGLYQPLLAPLARRLGAARVEALGTGLAFTAGRATGRCAGPVCGGEEKVRLIRARIGTGTLAAAYGDTAPDAHMLALSAAPVAVHPDAGLRQIAQTRGWRIIPSPPSA